MVGPHPRTAWPHGTCPPLDVLFRGLPDAVLVTDAGGHVLATNGALEALLGAPAGDLEGRHVAEILPEAVADLLGTLAAGEEAGPAPRPPRRFEARLPRRGADEVAVEITASLVIHRGEVSAVAAFREVPEAPEGPEDVAERAPREGEGPAACASILVVDDERAIRRLVAHALADAGYEILTAADAEEALALVAARPRPVDLVVTDVVMPGLDGRGLVARLRARCPHVPVLFMSGHDERLVTGGAPFRDPFLAKPFGPGVLLRKVRVVLGRRARNRQ